MTVLRDDVDQLMAVMDAAFDPQFGEAWTRRQVDDALLSGLCHYRIFDRQSGVVDHEPGPTGFYLSRHIAGEEELLLFAVVPSARRLGIGCAILRMFCQDSKNRGANRLLLEMRDGNPARALYERLGFNPIGRRLNYYRNGLGSSRDAITFACEI